MARLNAKVTLLASLVALSVAASVAVQACAGSTVVGSGPQQCAVNTTGRPCTAAPVTAVQQPSLHILNSSPAQGILLGQAETPEDGCSPGLGPGSTCMALSEGGNLTTPLGSPHGDHGVETLAFLSPDEDPDTSTAGGPKQALATCSLRDTQLLPRAASSARLAGSGGFSGNTTTTTNNNNNTGATGLSLPGACRQPGVPTKAAAAAAASTAPGAGVRAGGVLQMLSPRSWGIFNGRFDPRKALRACAAYSTIGLIPTLTAMLFDCVYAPWLLRRGLATRTSQHYITAPWQRIMWDMFAATTITLAPLVAFGTAMHADALWPVVFEYGLQPFALVWATTLMLLVHDTYYYFCHRLLHANRWLYKHVHAHHHDPRVMLEARTGLVITCAESVLAHCIPYALTLALNMALFTRVVGGIHLANIPTLVAPMIVSTQLGMIGHSGMRYSSPLVLVALNPLFGCLLFTGTAHSPTDHQHHHERGRVNLSLYYRHWDCWCGTHMAGDSGDKRAGASPLLIALNLFYYLAATWALANATWLLPALLTSRACPALLALLALLPASSSGWPWLRRLPVWDAVRSAYACTVTCAAPGVPFDPCQKYVFGYHPHGRLARGLWLVFGLTGRQSPVSGLRVSLPVVSVLLRIPGVRHVYGLLGGCGADRATLLRKLQAKEPTSIAIAPGGLAEARFGRSSKVLLSRRMGFVRLAVESGAQLVPVLAIGEEAVGGAYASTLTAALLLPAKRVPLHVVIGAPMAPEGNEELPAFHARYVAALLELGRQHGVELEVL